MSDVVASIPRHLLPQIPKEKLGEFVRYLHEHDVGISKRDLPVAKLLPIQKHINREKVENFKSNPSAIHKIPIIVTSEGFIVDGHHRWVAAKELEENSISCIVCDCPLLKFLKLSHQFEGSYVKSVNELTTYGKLAFLIENSDTKIIEFLRNRLKEDDAEELTYDDGYGPNMKYDDSFGNSVPGTI